MTFWAQLEALRENSQRNVELRDALAELFLWLVKVGPFQHWMDVDCKCKRSQFPNKCFSARFCPRSPGKAGCLHRAWFLLHSFANSHAGPLKIHEGRRPQSTRFWAPGSGSCSRTQRVVASGRPSFSGCGLACRRPDVVAPSGDQNDLWAHNNEWFKTWFKSLVPYSQEFVANPNLQTCPGGWTHVWWIYGKAYQEIKTIKLLRWFLKAIRLP